MYHCFASKAMYRDRVTRVTCRRAGACRNNVHRHNSSLPRPLANAPASHALLYLTSMCTTDVRAWWRYGTWNRCYLQKSTYITGSTRIYMHAPCGLRGKGRRAGVTHSNQHRPLADALTPKLLWHVSPMYDIGSFPTASIYFVRQSAAVHRCRVAPYIRCCGTGQYVSLMGTINE